MAVTLRRGLGSRSPPARMISALTTLERPPTRARAAEAFACAGEEFPDELGEGGEDWLVARFGFVGEGGAAQLVQIPAGPPGQRGLVGDLGVGQPSGVLLEHSAA